MELEVVYSKTNDVVILTWERMYSTLYSKKKLQRELQEAVQPILVSAGTWPAPRAKERDARWTGDGSKAALSDRWAFLYPASHTGF